MRTFNVGDSSPNERDVYDIIFSLILRFIRKDLPVLISTVRDKLISFMDERLRILQVELEASHPWDKRGTFREFNAYGAPRFFGGREPIVSMIWIPDVESAFHTNFCQMEAKFRFATCILCDRARD